LSPRCADRAAARCAPQAKLARSEEERDFLTQLSDTVLSNQRTLQEQIRTAEAASRDTTDSREAHIKASALAASVLTAFALGAHCLATLRC
jgi:hypothetical protein